MLNHITPPDKLFIEASEIQSFAEITTGDDPNEIADRIASCSVYIARTGKMLADAKYHLNAKKKEETLSIISKILKNDKVSKTLQNSLIDSICKEEQYLVDWIERLNKAVTHQMEACRSLLSYEKENLRISNFNGN